MDPPAHAGLDREVVESECRHVVPCLSFRSMGQSPQKLRNSNLRYRNLEGGRYRGVRDTRVLGAGTAGSRRSL
ncbi:hypothetical protein RE9431_13620 [Prescottella equi]|nr:hypothetical protein RE9431_13620 [Prescottella equi]